MSDKPTIFIASSSEAISVAEAVHIKLEQEMRVKLWENAFDLSSITITTLIGKTKEADYAVFVFHPDDKTLIREKEYSSVRDNVVLELGMFIGIIIQTPIVKFIYFYKKSRSFMTYYHE